MYLQQYLKLRSSAVAALKKTGPHPYPHKFHVTTSLTAFIDQYQSLGDGEHHADIVSVAGEDTSICFLSISILSSHPLLCLALYFVAHFSM